MRPEVPGSGSAGPVPEGTAPFPAPPRPREPLSPRGSFERSVRAGREGAAGPPAWPGRPRRRGGARRRALWGLQLLSLAGLALAAFGLIQQVLPRSFTSAQAQRIANWEMSRRWREWPAGRIFPAAVGYRLPSELFGGGPPVALSAARVGIARQSGCAAGLDTAAAREVGRRGCLAVLRATYDDSTRALAVTVGVVVTPDPAAARFDRRALADGAASGQALRSAPFRRTPVARFGDRQRQVSWREAVGPYLVLATAGFADGRRRVGVPADHYLQGEMMSLARGVGGAVGGSLGAAPPPPGCPGGPGC